MNNMTALASIQGQDGILAVIQLMKNWKEVEKALTDFEAFRAEHNAKVKEVNEEIAKTIEGRKVLDGEIEKFHAEASVEAKRLDVLTTKLEAHVIEINTRASNLETWELALQREKEEVEAKSKRADAAVQEAKDKELAANKLHASAQEAKASYLSKMEKLRSLTN